MVFINEWLPNPYDGSAGQFIELWDNGPAPVDLSGWRLEKANGKTFWLDGYRVPAGGYLVLTRGETRLALKHSNEGLSLYDSRGRLVDRASFDGAAGKGKGFSRVDYGRGPEQHFAWGVPTPGTPNAVALDASVSANRYPLHVPINVPALGVSQFLGLLFSVSTLLAVLVVYFVKHDKKASQLFFGGDETIR